MTKEKAELITNELLEKVGIKYSRNENEYYIENITKQCLDDSNNEYTVLVHLKSNTDKNSTILEYEKFILEYYLSV